MANVEMQETAQAIKVIELACLAQTEEYYKLEKQKVLLESKTEVEIARDKTAYPNDTARKAAIVEWKNEDDEYLTLCEKMEDIYHNRNLNYIELGYLKSIFESHKF